jgi:hypothetical protein
MKKNGVLTIGRLKSASLLIFCVIWSALQFTMCLTEFLYTDKFTVPAEMPFVYVLLFLLYVEVEQWLRRQWKHDTGELFLIGWWFAMLVMYVIEFATISKYSVPRRMVETCVLMLVPFVLGIFSKVMHKRNARKQHAYPHGRTLSRR